MMVTRWGGFFKVWPSALPPFFLWRFWSTCPLKLCLQDSPLSQAWGFNCQTENAVKSSLKSAWNSETHWCFGFVVRFEANVCVSKYTAASPHPTCAELETRLHLFCPFFGLFQMGHARNPMFTYFFFPLVCHCSLKEIWQIVIKWLFFYHKMEKWSTNHCFPVSCQYNYRVS